MPGGGWESGVCEVVEWSEVGVTAFGAVGRMLGRWFVSQQFRWRFRNNPF